MQRDSHSVYAGGLDFEAVVTVLRRRWWVIGLITVIAGGASFVFSKQETKQYTATTAVLFENPQLGQQESGLQVTPTSPTEDPTIMATNVRLLSQQSGVAAATATVVGRASRRRNFPRAKRFTKWSDEHRQRFRN